MSHAVVCLDSFSFDGLTNGSIVKAIIFELVKLFVLTCLEVSVVLMVVVSRFVILSVQI